MSSKKLEEEERDHTRPERGEKTNIEHCPLFPSLNLGGAVLPQYGRQRGALNDYWGWRHHLKKPISQSNGPDAV